MHGLSIGVFSTTTTTTTQLAPVVTIKDGKVFANSRDVADFFEKDHKHVLRDILHILEDGGEEGVSKFGLTPWFIRTYTKNEQNGQMYPTYDMTRDGFTLLVMGYTGKTAMDFKVRYIQQFNAMEASLRNQAPAQAEKVPATGLI